MKELKLLSDIALTVVNKETFENQINSVLKIIGEYFQVSRTYIFIDNDDGTQTSNTFEWCNHNIIPQIDNLQNISYQNIPFWKELLKSDEKILFENIKELPNEIYEILQTQGILSILVYPLYIKGKIKGFIGFDECKKYRKWTEIETDILKTVSGLISSVYERFFTQKELYTDKNNFENFFNTIDDLMIIGDLQGKIIYVNNSVIKKLGYSVNELLKMNFLDIHPFELRKEASEIIISMINHEKDYCPLPLLSKDNKYIPVETRIWFGKWNNQDCIFGILKDLSREQEALQKFTKLFENNPALMAVSILPDRKFIDVNNAFIQKLGYLKEEILGSTAAELDLFVDLKKQEELSKKIKTEGKILNTELQVKCKNNDILDGLFSGEIIESQGKKYLLTVMVDITEQKKLQLVSNIQKNKLNNIIEGTRLGTWEWNIQTGELIINERWAEIIGFTLEELQPVNIETWIFYTCKEDLKKSTELLQEHFDGKSEFYDFECKMKHKNGNWVWVRDRGKVMEWDNNGNPLKMFGTHCDITKNKETEDKIREMAIKDMLTNIYNRRYLFERLETAISQFKRDKVNFAISILDIDFFKKINDLFGHPAGDFILKEFTKVITENIRNYDLLGRYGGEEFIIITFNTEKKIILKRLEIILYKIQNSTFIYDNHQITFTFSCGISDTNDLNLNEISLENLIKIADKRLYIAKETGRNKIVIN